MKKLFLIPILAASLTLSGCATKLTTSISTPILPEVTPTAEHQADPIVVNAERTLSTARDTFRFIAHEERQNEAVFAQVSPSIHNFVQHIRTDGVTWLRTAESMKTKYKENRSPDNKRNLITAVATVSEALNQSKQYLAQAGYKN